MGKYKIRSRLTVLLFLITSSPLLFAQEGKLEDIRNETNKTSSRDHSDNKSSYDSVEADSFFMEIFGPILSYIFISPYSVPYTFWDDGFDTHLCFHPYPYYSTEKGYLTESDDLKGLAFDLSSAYKIYRGDVYGVGLNFKARTNFRFEVHADYNYLEEKLDNGTKDSLYLGNINVLYRFAQNERLLMHSGLGLNILHDKEDKFGFNYNYSLEAYPFKPMYLAIGVDLGLLGGASYVRFRTMVGVVYRSYEVNIGFESYNIGDTSLEGLIFGFKMYF